MQYFQSEKKKRASFQEIQIFVAKAKDDHLHHLTARSGRASCSGLTQSITHILSHGLPRIVSYEHPPWPPLYPPPMASPMASTRISHPAQPVALPSHPSLGSPAHHSASSTPRVQIYGWCVCLIKYKLTFPFSNEINILYC